MRVPHWQVVAYGAAARLVPLAAPAILRRRLARGKEDPARWRERLGIAGAARPEGSLVWLHAVGLGEVLALRGLIAAMAGLRPGLEFLITSVACSSAGVIAGQMPAHTRHQFLPLDAPRYLGRFLRHWRPSLSVWAEQDLWPGAVLAADRAGVPLAMVNARMSDAALARRWRARGLYGDLLARFRLVAAQDAGTAANLACLGARDVKVTGPLKAAAPPLVADEGALAAARAALAGRRAWLLASSHPEDEAIALAAQVRLSAADPARLLVIAPREPSRGKEIARSAAALGLDARLRSRGEKPAGWAAGGPVRGSARGAAWGDVWVADSFGEMGLWLRLCPVVLVGGSFGPVEGHNPWEAAALGAAILHGPRVANFAADYALLDREDAALAIGAETLAQAVAGDHRAMIAGAAALMHSARAGLLPLARDLVALVR